MDLDEFSDDGFDDIPAAALQELERHAIQSTQAQLHPQTTEVETVWIEDDDEDLDTTEVINDGGLPLGRPPGGGRQGPSQESLPLMPPPPPHVNSNWNTAKVAPQSSATSNLPNRQRMPPSVNPSQYGSQRYQPPASSRQPTTSQFAKPPLPPHRAGPSASQIGIDGPQGDIMTALQRRVRALETEVNVARGEASILRTNVTKMQQDHTAELARLKKMNAEQASKQEKLVEAAVAAEKSASTELQFLQRDLKEVKDRGANRRHNSGEKSGGNSTPKKTNKSWGFADGFDEVDKFPSPTKPGARGRGGPVAAGVGERTPSKGKRKRVFDDSPIMALETHTEDVSMADAGPPGASQPRVPPVMQHLPETPPFEFLHLVLDHGSSRDQPPTFDLLSRFSFPSDPSTSFSALIFQKLPLMGSPSRPMQLLVDFCELVTSIWARCFEERYYEPIRHLVALISFTFALHTTTVAVWVVKNLATTARTTIHMMAEGRHRLPDGDLEKSEGWREIAGWIDTTRILSLLHVVGMACANTPVKTETGGLEFQTETLWRLLTMDFIVLLLKPKQKYEDVIAVLGLLTTSTLPTSIGPIEEEKEASFTAPYIIDLVCARLVEFPWSATTPSSQRRVQSAALRTLIAFSRHAFGAIQIATHKKALPRLIDCLSTSIDSLYDQDIPLAIFPPDPLPHGNGSSSFHSEEYPVLDPSAMLCRIISQCVLLLHFLVTSPDTADIVDLPRKLAGSLGGSQRHLIALSRVAFTEEESLVLESGFELEVVEAAQGLLDIAKTPDEGELIAEAFGQ